MELSNYFLWFGCIVVLYTALTITQIPLHKFNRLWLNIIILVVKIILVLLFAFLNISIEGFLLWRIPLILGGLHVIFSAEVVVDIIYLIVGIFKKGKMRLFTRNAIGLMATLILALAGTINMQTITPSYKEYKSDLLNHNYKVIFVSDLHYGSAQGFGVVDKLFENIKSENPDILILGGDITDEFTKKDEMMYLYSLIGEYNMNTYFIYGNHDRQGHASYIGGPQYTEEELINTLKANNITILKDEYRTINDDLVILGRESYNSPDRKKVEDLPARPEGKFVINIDHSPYLEDDIIKTKANLQISGHTHDGQYFPLDLIYSMTVKYSHGWFKVGGTDLFVSAGAGGWYVPYRTSSFCNYEVFNLSR